MSTCLSFFEIKEDDILRHPIDAEMGQGQLFLLLTKICKYVMQDI